MPEQTQRQLGPNMEELAGDKYDWIGETSFEVYSDGAVIHRIGWNHEGITDSLSQAVAELRGRERALGHKLESLNIMVCAFPYERFMTFCANHPSKPDNFWVYRGPTKEVLEFVYGSFSEDDLVISEGESALVSRELLKNPFSGVH